MVSIVHPDEAWICGQAKAFVGHVRKAKLGADLVMHDRDTKFTAKFDATLKVAGLRVEKSPFRSPNMVAFVERFIQTLRQECLDHFIVFGERHLNYLCSEFVDYYHRRRPHHAKDNELLVTKRGRQKKVTTDVIPLSDVRCEQRLGGLLKHYYHKAA